MPKGFDLRCAAGQTVRVWLQGKGGALKPGQGFVMLPPKGEEDENSPAGYLAPLRQVLIDDPSRRIAPKVGSPAAMITANLVARGLVRQNLDLHRVRGNYDAPVTSRLFIWCGRGLSVGSISAGVFYSAGPRRMMPVEIGSLRYSLRSTPRGLKSPKMSATTINRSATRATRSARNDRNARKVDIVAALLSLPPRV